MQPDANSSHDIRHHCHYFPSGGSPGTLTPFPDYVGSVSSKNGPADSRLVGPSKALTTPFHSTILLHHTIARRLLTPQKYVVCTCSGAHHEYTCTKIPLVWSDNLSLVQSCCLSLTSGNYSIIPGSLQTSWSIQQRPTNNIIMFTRPCS